MFYSFTVFLRIEKTFLSLYTTMNKLQLEQHYLFLNPVKDPSRPKERRNYSIWILKSNIL